MRTAFMFAFAATLLASTSTAWAQRDAASKIDGAVYEAPYFYDTSDMYQQNAYEHARVLQVATASGQPVPQEIAKEHAAAIRSNLQASQKHITKLKASVKGNAAANKHLDEIQAHHQKALALSDKIDAAAASGKGDAKAINSHAAEIAAELKASHDKHKKAAEPLSSGK